MFRCVHIILIIFSLTKSEAVTINGSCPDFASKLPCNWLAMQGTWYEVQRSSQKSALQSGTFCESLNITNVDRDIEIHRKFKNEHNEIKNYHHSFEMTSEPYMQIKFQPGKTKELTLMASNYLDNAVFYLCEPHNQSESNLKSNIYFWVYCRNKTLTEECKYHTNLTFKVRKAQDFLPYLQNTDQSCE